MPSVSSGASALLPPEHAVENGLFFFECERKVAVEFAQTGNFAGDGDVLQLPMTGEPFRQPVDELAHAAHRARRD